MRLCDSVLYGLSGLCPTNNPNFCIPTVMTLTQRRSQQCNYEVHSVAAFVQQLAVSLVGQGYWFYVTGEIPPEKSAEAVDQKLVERYGVGVSKWSRARRKAAGLANVRYLRHGRFFVLIATRGDHAFFALEPAFHDVRRRPIKYGGYSIGCARGRDGAYHPSVRIERNEYRALKAYFVRLANRRPAAELSELFSSLPYEPYAPVRRQLLELLRAVNRTRRNGGREAVPLSSLRLRRTPVRVFARAPSY